MIYELPIPVLVAIYIVLLMMAYYSGVSIVKNVYKGDAGNFKSDYISVGGTLLSLLLGFTVNNAAEKSSARKQNLSDEVNAISTCIDRTGLYSDSVKLELLTDLKKYAMARNQYLDAGAESSMIRKAYHVSDSMYNELKSVVISRASGLENLIASQLMIPAVNDLSDLAQQGEFLRNSRVPEATMKLLLLLGMIVAFTNGARAGSEPNLISAFGFAALIGMTLYLILDLDSSREGFITFKDQQEGLIELIRQIP